MAEGKMPRAMMRAAMSASAMAVAAGGRMEEFWILDSGFWIDGDSVVVGGVAIRAVFRMIR